MRFAEHMARKIATDIYIISLGDRGIKVGNLAFARRINFPSDTSLE
jgi:hypothetical protein